MLGITDIEKTMVVLMSAMPVAVSVIVLSERYDFYRKTIASLILISSLGSTIDLPVGLLITGVR